MNQHEGHDVQLMEKCVDSYDFTIEGDDVLQGKNRNHDTLDLFFHCGTCGEIIPSEELGLDNNFVVW